MSYIEKKRQICYSVCILEIENGWFINMKRELIESNCEKDTRDLGFRLGQAAEPGQVYTLVGDLGVGKTVFTQGLAAGLGIEEPVSSPTFTIVQV